MILLITTTSLLAVIPLVIYIYYKRKHSYWRRRNVPFISPSFPFGNISDFVLRKSSILHLFRSLYFRSKSLGYKYVGVYLYARKGLIIVDPTLAKRILATDFQYFHDRDIYYDEKNDPLTANLVAITGQKWKSLRAKLTPTFTSGKLKNMFKTVMNCGDELKLYLSDNVNDPKGIEIKDVLSRFTTNVIGRCAFGIECDTLANPNTDFSKYSQKAMTQSLRDVLKLAVYKNFPRLARFFKMKVVNEEVSKFFINIVQQTIEHREKNNVQRNDFMQLLIQLKNNGQLKQEQDDGRPQEAKPSDVTLTFNEIAAQSFIFFLAGYETSSTVTSFALYEIAQNGAMQEKLKQEVLETIRKYDGEITYDALVEMEYMEKVILGTYTQTVITS